MTKLSGGRHALWLFASRTNFTTAISLWLALCIAIILPCSARSQSWTAVQTTFTTGTPLLLTDGTVIIQVYSDAGWWRLTPDQFGNYTTGKWSRIASMPLVQGGQQFSPLFYASAVLADGRVVVVGGEYNQGFGPIWFNGGAIYDPVANQWAELPTPFGANIGDAASVVLPDGTFMLQDPFGSDVALLDPVTLTWSSPTPPRNGNYGKADGNDEEGWTLLPDGTVLTVDTIDLGNSELFDPVYGDWYTAGGTINVLPDAASEEMGPQVLRPDGTVVAFGATGFNSIYAWKGSTVESPAPGKWEAIQSFPFDPFLGQYECADAPATLLPNGNVLVAASPGIFGSPVEYFEVDAKTNAINRVPDADGAANSSCFQDVFLMLPSGQILMTGESNEVQFYNPVPGYNAAWAPAITSSPAQVSPGHTYQLYGTQFNGLSLGAAYGDDNQTATNYPLVRVTMNATGHVIYYRTHDHSTMAVATGQTPVSTNFDVPAAAELGSALMEVVTNGIPSLPVPINVVPPPTATPQTVNVPHNKSASFMLTGNDPSGLVLTFLLGSGPTNGTLSNFNPNTGAITYTPNTNYQGKDSFTFTVSDGYITSVPATVRLIIAPGTPVANAQTVSTGHDAGISITLTGSDPTDNPALPLTFAVATAPKNGTTSFLNPNTGTVTYLPNANFQGTDSFTFTVSNGVVSKPATVTVHVAPATPFANPQVVPVAKNTATTIALTGTDPDSPALPLTYAIFSTPAHGSLGALNATTGAVTYTPATNYQGNDSFQFTVSNGVYVSVRATVTLVVAPATPVAHSQSVAVPHNKAVSITVTATDPDNPPLPVTYAIVTAPTHGALSGFNAATGMVTYTPTANFQGTDSFTFTANNGINTSLPGKVTLTVAPGVPTASPQSVAVAHNAAKGFTLKGTDPDVPALKLTYAIAGVPTHGSASVNSATGACTYTPAANFQGMDSFTFTVSNGVNTSSPATVTLTVAPGVPTAHTQSVTVTENSPVTITLTGTDPDNPALPLTFAIAANPTHGTLSNFNASTGRVTYTPNANYKGADSFTFTVSNGAYKSSAAKVTLSVVSTGP